MDTQNENEYSKIVNVFTTLTPEEAERVLEFMRQLRPCPNDTEYTV